MSEGRPGFSEEESALILRRAAELQAQEGRSLSLRELEAAATEAGIDAALVRRAAQEVAIEGPPPAPPAPAPVHGGALGAPLHLVHERVVAGEGRGHWDEVVAELNRRLDVPGRLETGDRRLSWHGGLGRKVRVSIVVRAGRRLIRVEERVGELGGGLFLGMALPMTAAGLGFILPICIAVLAMPVMIPVMLVAWGGLSFLLARTIFTTIVRQRDAELRALADGLAEVCGSEPPALTGEP
ncbi:hypothetical protein [Paraliomyxa miuraensis]|uniref:hypothetical protein n=1 Tax=Paraliomyxa miuraensis TaxID=376150 RepID=UPI00225787C0|nr:hypothetical protein [Paraliomyxa miuraensis]MCX4245063.1 hypothetical protein [Paraliomyxa miuraensis]